MTSQIVNRDDLIDDARFWCLLYESWLKPCVGDPFTEGEEYFFSIREEAICGIFRELEGAAVAEGFYPAISVLVNLANGWRAGVDLMMCPGDFEMDYVVVPPSSDEHKILGVHGGNHWLPALRWEEVLILANAIQPATTLSRARGVLLFYPAAMPDESQRAEVRDALRQAWKESGFSIRHLEEWIERTDQGGLPYHWKQDPTYGWICDHDHSLRNPHWAGRHHRWTSGMLTAVAQLFATLE